MRTLRLTILAVAVSAASLAATAHAEPPKKDAKEAKEKKPEQDKKQDAPPTAAFKKLGEREVNGKADKDVIKVGADEGQYSAIQVKVEGSALNMFDIKITFGNGETFEPKTKLTFDKDTTTRVIDLPGDQRIIKTVEFLK